MARWLPAYRQKKPRFMPSSAARSPSIPYAALGTGCRARGRKSAELGRGRGSRVGIFAPNSYHWLVYDLAMIEIGAISVPFTDDFAGKIDRELLDRYRISLASHFQKQRHVGDTAALYGAY